MLTEHNLMSVVYYGLQTAHIETRSLSVLPYHHTYEAVAGILVALHKHVCICINDSLKNVLKNLQLYKPDYIYLVPAFTEVFHKNIWANAKKTGKETGLKILIKVSNTLRKIGIDKRRQIFKDIHNSLGGKLRLFVAGAAAFDPEIETKLKNIAEKLNNREKINWEKGEQQKYYIYYNYFQNRLEDSYFKNYQNQPASLPQTAEIPWYGKWSC